jgi:hypothetical protein
MLLFAFLVCLVIQFGLPAWRWACPPGQWVPSSWQYDKHAVPYFPMDPPFSLQDEAEELKAAQEEANRSG